MADHMTDDQRRKLQEAMAVALLLIYRGRAKQAMQTLSQQEATLGIPLNVREKVNAFAADRAKKVQTGINQRLDKALTSLPDDATDSDKQQALSQAKSEIDSYNGTVLATFLTSWASHTAQSDVYSASTMPDGRNAREATQWIWEQRTDFEDSCTESEDASPASYDELVSIAGSEPPVHERCECSLSPE